MAKSRTQTPFDKHGNKTYRHIIAPTATALARTVQTVDESFKIELNELTSLISVYAIAKDVFFKWAIPVEGDEDYVTAENFDEVIIAGNYREFAVPVQPNGESYANIQLVGRESGATAIVVEK